ncbi:Tim44 domain-containing protein [Chitinimonas arctica]|uniref:Tim44 domain-containing protein n=1 Tax=Chitinimonas arctica TaxID=2594795 RepID=A0A516SDC4_9NEIS|nr:TIM44-like domain-containing protein [Chitinimonas arctica]QDQ26038.1 Tim44 domain-containing protein [Chitinimonas arctica]
MKRFFTTLFALFVSVAILAPEAEAKRFGGGRSSGMQRNVTPQRDAAPQRKADQPVQAAPAPAPKRSWMGPLAGLAAGLGLAALFSHLGIGAGMGNFIMLALLAGVAFLAIRWFMNRNKPAMQGAQGMQYAGAPGAGQAGNSPISFEKSPAGSTPFKPVSAASGGASVYPAGFDVEAFLRVGKVNYVRLQAAYDKADLDDISEFTTPEMFAEVKLEINERKGASNHTDVVNVDAELLEYVQEGHRDIASVRFHGLVRETADGSAMPFDEIWHLTKANKGRAGWVVAGIQQN